jgi:hypothetical protein
MITSKEIIERVTRRWEQKMTGQTFPETEIAGNVNLELMLLEFNGAELPCESTHLDSECSGKVTHWNAFANHAPIRLCDNAAQASLEAIASAAWVCQHCREHGVGKVALEDCWHVEPYTKFS